MLGDIARWLRASGHNTLLAKKGHADKEIYNTAQKEGRFLLTCDREYTKRKGHENYVILLKQGTLLEKIEQLNSRIEINWLVKPLTRCLECNVLLKTASEKEVQAQVPERIQKQYEEFFVCPLCQKIYWYGGHVERMLSKLKSFNRWHH